MRLSEVIMLNIPRLQRIKLHDLILKNIYSVSFDSNAKSSESNIKTLAFLFVNITYKKKNSVEFA